MEITGGPSSCAEGRMNTYPALQMRPSSSSRCDLHENVGTRRILLRRVSGRNRFGGCGGEFRGALRLPGEAAVVALGQPCVRNCKAGVAVAVQKLAENLVLGDLGGGDEGELEVKTEDMGSVIRREQFSGHVRPRRREAPNDILHNLAKAVALRVASENLTSDEDVMRVINEVGLRVDVRSMNVVVWQLGQMQNWHAATKVFRAFRSAGIEPNAYVCTTLIAALG